MDDCKQQNQNGGKQRLFMLLLQRFRQKQKKVLLCLCVFAKRYKMESDDGDSGGVVGSSSGGKGMHTYPSLHKNK